MKRNILISIWMTLATTVLLGIIYPIVVTGLAQVLFPRQANGELIQQAGGKIVGSSACSASRSRRRGISTRGRLPRELLDTIRWLRADQISVRRTRL